MKLPRVRFTVRRMMIVVVILGLGMGVGVGGMRLHERRQRFLSLATNFAAIEAIHRDRATRNEGRAELEAKAVASFETRGGRTNFDRTFLGKSRVALVEAREDAAEATRKAEYHASLKRKYATAAAGPWLTVGPDPPEPE